MQAIEDFTHNIGIPNTIKSDNAQSKLGHQWTKHCRQQCIKTETTEPFHPWQNLVEKRVGYLGSMIKKIMAEFGAPARVHNWAQKWCCQVHNILALRSKRWRTPMELSTGNTPDISCFRFHFWEPVWYFELSKAPDSLWCKGRWLGFAESSGDTMTYVIEKEDRPKSIIIRSGVRTRRQNIGQNNENHRESQTGMIMNEPETPSLNQQPPLPPLYNTNTYLQDENRDIDSGDILLDLYLFNVCMEDLAKVPWFLAYRWSVHHQVCEIDCGRMYDAA